MELKKYRKKGFIYAHKYNGELGDHRDMDSAGISVSKRHQHEVDDVNTPYGMIAVNPKDLDDQWYITKEYFDDNYEEIVE